jgi:hypothetical protein
LFKKLKKSVKCYEYWKQGFLNNLNKMISNFSHVQIDEITALSEENLLKHIEKLNSTPNYYEKLVKVIFK